jgi:hypothetical protein
VGGAVIKAHAGFALAEHVSNFPTAWNICEISACGDGWQSELLPTPVSRAATLMVKICVQAY